MRAPSAIAGKKNFTGDKGHLGMSTVESLILGADVAGMEKLRVRCGVFAIVRVRGVINVTFTSTYVLHMICQIENNNECDLSYSLNPAVCRTQYHSFTTDQRNKCMVCLLL